MSDIPRECSSHRRLLDDVHGRVFVAGLGIGVAVCLLEANPRVDCVVVVEYAKDLRKLIWPWLPKSKASLVIGDAYQIAAGMPRGSFDFAFLDTWPVSGSGVIEKYIEPARYACDHLTDGDQSRIRCWAEEETRNQYANEAARKASYDRQRGICFMADAFGVSREWGLGVLGKEIGLGFGQADWIVDSSGLTRRPRWVRRARKAAQLSGWEERRRPKPSLTVAKERAT